MKLYNDDCYKILHELPDNSIDLVYTDPPYDIGVNPNDTTGTCNTLMGLAKSLAPLNTLHCDEYALTRFYEECVRVLKTTNIYVWCNKSQIIDYFNIFVNKYNCKYTLLVWNKTNALPTYYNKYLDDLEFCLYFYAPGAYCSPKSYEDAKKLYVSGINRENKIYNHPTIKPLSFVKSMISNSTKEGYVVLDPFMGTGTTGIACKQLNRNLEFIGIEKELKYFETAVARINETQLPRDKVKKVLW